MLRGTVNKLTGRCLLQARYTQADWERRRQALASTQVYGASRLRLAACNVRTQCGFRWQITCFDFPRCWFLVSLCLQEMSRETRGCFFFSLFVFAVCCVYFRRFFLFLCLDVRFVFARLLFFVSFLAWRFLDRFSPVKWRRRWIDYLSEFILVIWAFGFGFCSRL